MVTITTHHFMTRIVGNLPQTVSQDDVAKLINKLCPVNEVYVPGATPTGIHRGFAIVRVNGDRSSVTKCVTFLSFARMTVEPAKEFYSDKLQREKSLPDPKPRRLIVEPEVTPHHSRQILRLKRRRGLVVKIALDENVKDEQCVHMRKVRRFVDGILEADSPSPDASQDPPTHQPTTTSGTIPASAPLIKPEKKLTSAPCGGGSRVGFGAVALAPIPEPTSNAILRDTYSADINGIEEDIPCVEAADVTDEALEKERQRVHDILNAVLATPSVTKVVKQKVLPAQASQETTSIVAMEADATFANLDELKGIFHKDGGIAFGDGVNEAIVSNEYQNDVLFKEAELMGFDIRKEEDSANAMKFDFFGDATDLPAAPAAGVLASEPVATVIPVPVATKPRPEIIKKAPKKVTLATFRDIVRNALRFRRHKTEAEVISDWKTSREKLMVDYKRKKKQARKKSEQAKHGKR